MASYQKIRHKAMLLLENTKQGELITEPDELASFFSEEISLQSFLVHVYNKNIAEALRRNKAMIKHNIKSRWFISNKTKALENVYKLLATSDELNRLKGEGNQEASSGSDPLLEALNPREIWSE